MRENTRGLQHFRTFSTDVSRNNHFLNAVIFSANKLLEKLTFDLKNSCLLELFKNELKNSVGIYFISLKNY